VSRGRGWIDDACSGASRHRRNPAEEALAEACATDVDGEPTRVSSAGYLVAIALETGRAKDMARIHQFVDAGVLDADKLLGDLP